ncbi:hypothetical protein [Adhaeretor mobilis]|uniref:Uncharacterized protein n=1 Tax=Adhaeretor mobilis TaxID=1930276 RepID=A0A517MXW8_9BACT|nr:hypothetical protein [Adhaeretor mobilis]QDS99720.1 hypothetical protein HG15A2_30490 [Adhaeretor mobilis]
MRSPTPTHAPARKSSASTSPGTQPPAAEPFGRSSSRSTLLGPHTVDAAFEDQEARWLTPTTAPEDKELSLFGNLTQQLNSLKEQELRLRELLRTSR